MAFSPLEWTFPTQICSVHQVTTALREGRPLAGNIVHTNQIEDVSLIKLLWLTYQVEQGMTIVVSGDAKSIPGAIFSKARLTRQGRSPRLENVALVYLGTGSPHMRPATKVSGPTIAQVDRCPQIPAVLADMARTSGIPAHVLTGGRWEKQTFGNKAPNLWDGSDFLCHMLRHC